jgi:hypothetical protein
MLREVSLHEVTESMYISLPADFLAKLVSQARNLESLDLGVPFPLITQKHIVSVRHFNTVTTKLSLAGNPSFSTATLPDFLSFFPNLESLDLSGTNGVSPRLFTTVPLMKLTSLRLRHQGYKVTDDTVHDIASSRKSNLLDLDLSYIGKSISSKSLSWIQHFCAAKPPLYSAESISVDVGPGLRKLGLAYTGIPLPSIASFLSSELLHLTHLDLAGLSGPLSTFWPSFCSGGSFGFILALRIEWNLFQESVFRAWNHPPRMETLTLHRVPSRDPAEGGLTTRTLILFLSRPRERLREVNLEMAPSDEGEEVRLEEPGSEVDGIDVVEEIKSWRRRGGGFRGGSIRVLRDVIGMREFAQEGVPGGMEDILGQF